MSRFSMDRWRATLDWTRILPPRLRTRATPIGRMILVAFLLRVLLMPLFAGADSITTAWISTVLLAKGQLILSNDPPGIFYLNALVFAVFRPLYPPNIYAQFLSPVGYTPATFLQSSVLLEPGIAVLVTLLKLPYLVFDLATAVLWLWLVKDPDLAQTAMKWWLFNPVVLYVTYVIGQYDVVAVFFLLLAYYFERDRRRPEALAALAAAIFIKIFAIILAPLFLLLYWEESKQTAERLRAAGKVVAAAILPIVLQFAVTFLQPVFYESANFALSGDKMNGFFGPTLYNRGAATSPLAEGLLTFLSYSVRLPVQAPIPDVLYLLPLAYLVFLLAWAYARNKDFDKLLAATTVVFLFVYSFSLYFPQWFLWAQPFFILTVLRNRERFARLYVGLVALFFVYVWYWDGELTVHLIAPLVPAAANWPGPVTYFNSVGVPVLLFLNLAHTAFAAIGVFIAYLTVRTEILPPRSAAA